MSGELKKAVKQLQTATSDEDIIYHLQHLKKNFQVTEAILRESKAGLAVGKLRTHGTKEVSELAKELVKRWKSDVGKEKDKHSATAKKSAAGAPAAKTPVTPTGTSALRSAKIDGVSINIYNDKTRDKCIELIYDALSCDSNAPSVQIMEKARIIELSVYQANGSTTAEYKGKLRSLFVNLKDKNNPSLRESVVSGDLDASKLHTMTNTELASEERQAANKKIEEENLFKTLGAGEQQAETDAFQCSRCKQRKCRYRQAQTRSADEPMTTFVTCTVCNNRWKFS